MKKIFLFLISTFLIVSCVDEDLNVDKKNPSEVSGATLFANGTRNMFDLMNSCSVNENVFRLYAQYWAQTTYPDESQFNQVSRNIGGVIWNTLYRDVLKDLDGAKISTENSVDNPNKENQLAIIEFTTVYAYSILVDTFGNVPYTEALDPNNPTPKYDDAETIYLDLLDRLSNAIQKIDTNGSFGFDDFIYGGDLSKWKKAANSLMLRMAMRIADSNPTESVQFANLASADLILNNSDNFSINYLGASPNTNPLYVSLVQSGRNDFVAANTFVNKMQPREYLIYDSSDLNGDGVIDEKDEVEYIDPDSFTNTDPRMFVYFRTNKVVPEELNITDSNDNVVATFSYTDAYNNQTQLFEGGTYGTANSHSGHTQLGDILRVPDLKGTIISATEIRFLLAEASARGGYSVGGDTETHYNEGIRASFDEWEVSDVDSYLAMSHVAYSTASGDWKEKIATQKWLALYNNGFEGWTTWRLFDQPTLNNLPVADPEQIPTRFLYPTSESTLNGTNYQSASSSIGGDEKTTKIFWDKN
ncbi:SusD/RagB family nutrient-binding outer membrane lipoprotein [Tenacibaculum sp.]|uniref:SusD/RagB family nutrient-binding outer membrane lipoprotein n=1 Tax=Tenacibaculum sp. TaxID=1906242 RepID=UPI003AA96DB7